MDPVFSPGMVSSRQDQTPVQRSDAYSLGEAKRRRKVRKGTHSCWECKRRKMKCIFDPLAKPTCNGCRRRGTKCISQELPEELSHSIEIPHTIDHHDMADGVARVEAPSYRFGSIESSREPTTAGQETRGTDHGILTPASVNLEYSHLAKTGGLPLPSDPIVFHSGTNASPGKNERLSRFLHASLPSREDVVKMFEARHRPSVLAHEILSKSYKTLEHFGLNDPKILLDFPEPNTHPVLIARHMFKLAVFLQHIHPDVHEMQGLSESPRTIMERLSNLATSLVTTNDELLGSTEGLECIMIQGMYEVNVGNLRRSWVTSRRAISIAQLMGLNRPESHDRTQWKVLDPKTIHDVQNMWFRILFIDRQLCVMLGLPQNSLDRSIISDAILEKDTPMGRLERIHCALASRILERNESNNYQDPTLTRSLDMELQRAARSLPSKWWLAPRLDISTDSHTLYWDTLRLFAQVSHYNLVNQLHLPFMLCSRSEPPEHKLNHEYYRLTCVNASREVLSRFIAVRSFNRIAYTCRIIDFLALMAALTLLLAHLDSHRSAEAEGENLLAHQYLSDRAMIEQAQENMREVNRLSSDALSAQSADLLERLLAIELDAPDCAKRVSVQNASAEGTDQDEDAVVTMYIPYFGIIKIAREGVSKEVRRPQSTVQLDAGYVHIEAPPILSQEDSGRHSTASAAFNQTAASFALSETPFRQEEYPGLTAGGEDWAFQGVDMAFFDSIMRSNGNDENAEWMT